MAGHVCLPSPDKDMGVLRVYTSESGDSLAFVCMDVRDDKAIMPVSTYVIKIAAAESYAGVRVVWWRQIGTIVEMLLKSEHVVLAFASVDLSNESFACIPKLVTNQRARQPTDELVAKRKRYNVYAAASQLRGNADFKDRGPGLSCGDNQSLVGERVVLPCTADSFSIEYVESRKRTYDPCDDVQPLNSDQMVCGNDEFTRSNVKIKKVFREGRKRVDYLIVGGKRVGSFRQGLEIVHLSGDRIVIRGTKRSGREPMGAIYEYSYMSGLRLLDGADLRDFCTPIDKPLSRQFTYILDSAATGGRTAIYKDHNSNWLRYDIGAGECVDGLVW